jgi:hypothetical protein
MRRTYPNQRKWVSELVYKPGWTFSFDYDEEPDGEIIGPSLLIDMDVPDSTAPGEMTWILHVMPLPSFALKSRAALHREVLECIHQAERHESMEFLRVKASGEYVRNPHLSSGEDLYE